MSQTGTGTKITTAQWPLLLQQQQSTKQMELVWFNKNRKERNKTMISLLVRRKTSITFAKMDGIVLVCF